MPDYRAFGLGVLVILFGVLMFVKVPRSIPLPAPSIEYWIVYIASILLVVGGLYIIYKSLKWNKMLLPPV